MQPAFEPAVKHVSLLGADHPALGDVAVATLDPSTAVGISAGKLPKPYAHLDPNEDAVLAAHSGAATLLTVADGHSGFDAARAAIGGVVELLGQPATPWSANPAETVETLLRGAHRQVRIALAEAPRERLQSRTALSVALISEGHLFAGGWGDTQIVRARGSKARLVGTDGPFLEPSAGDTPRIFRVRLRPGDVVLACSDGLRDYLGGDWASHAAQVASLSRDATAAVRGLIDEAWKGGAGDHVSVAVTQWAA